MSELMEIGVPLLRFIQQMANVHPWFANTTVQNGPQWTWDFFDQTNVAAANAVSNKPQMSIAEVGWPTVGILFSGGVY